MFANTLPAGKAVSAASGCRASAAAAQLEQAAGLGEAVEALQIAPISRVWYSTLRELQSQNLLI